MGGEDKAICFVICEIGQEGSDERKRADDIFEYLIEPVAAACGYQARRSDHYPNPGIITEQIVRELIDAPMVVADLTGRNANVFYELAIRHMARQPSAQIAEKDEELPFDVNQLRVTWVEHDLNVRSVEVAKRTLAGQIRFASEHPDQIITPVSLAGDFRALEQSKHPVESAMRAIMEKLSGMSTRIDDLAYVVGEAVGIPDYVLTSDYEAAQEAGVVAPSGVARWGRFPPRARLRPRDVG